MRACFKEDFLGNSEASAENKKEQPISSTDAIRRSGGEDDSEKAELNKYLVSTYKSCTFQRCENVEQPSISKCDTMAVDNIKIEPNLANLEVNKTQGYESMGNIVPRNWQKVCRNPCFQYFGQ